MISFDVLKNHYANQIRDRNAIASIVGVLECDKYLDKICCSTAYDYKEVYSLLSLGVVSWCEMKSMIKESK